MKVKQKLLIPLMLLFLVSIGSDWRADNKDKGTRVKPVIKSVQLYSDQALVERHGRISLKRGVNHFFITDLPALMMNNTVQVSVKRTGGVLIKEIRVESRYKKYINQKKLKMQKRTSERQNQNLRY